MLITALSDETEADIENQLSCFKKLGIAFIELQNFDNIPQLKEDLDKHNIKVSAIRGGNTEIAKSLDCKYIISEFENTDDDITFLFENQTESIEECLKILESSDVKMLFNPANFVLCGEDVKKAFDALLPYIEYVRITDVLKNGRYVPAGAGDCEIRYIVNTLKNRGFDGFLSIEHRLGKNDEQTLLFALNSFKIIM